MRQWSVHALTCVLDCTDKGHRKHRSVLPSLPTDHHDTHWAQQGEPALESRFEALVAVSVAHLAIVCYRYPRVGLSEPLLAPGTASIWWKMVISVLSS
jgi:hypothetical protein